MTHRLRPSWKSRLPSVIPFDLGRTKTRHFRDRLGIVWRNRDRLGDAWKGITRGVCAGGALRVSGLHGGTMDGFPVPDWNGLTAVEEL